ncbi:MAG: peroxiredoxin [Archaeoglobaceae archaeon]|nr:peroxiredoxin [Archaeoglobaceae archaeon]MCX8152419.1 peroxiredoxin [Archaeoglobaceae archaeon]MDW8013759.1 peroxiredoxin [Archaeoglobaceae archaeon]
MITLGSKFPELLVKTTHGDIKLPDHYKGKWFILFAHPADFTPVCTTEFVAFQMRYDKFRQMNCELIGLSIDQTFSHIKWVEWIKDKLGIQVEFPIIADDLGEVSKALGLIHPAKGTNTVRAVFIVDPAGTIRLILYYPQEIGRNIDEILRALKALQTSDANKVAIPANWPQNELIGDKVIIPPARTMKDATERLEKIKKKELEGYDWWFAFKKL